MPDKSQRTERPTAKHRKEMRDKGNVARSAELGGWASFLLIVSLMPWLGRVAANRITGFALETMRDMGRPSPGMAVAILGGGLKTAALAALPLLGFGGALAVAIAFAQVGLKFSPKGFRIQVSRISPKAGFKRTFSSQGVWSLVKTLMKMIMLTAVGYLILRGLIDSILGGFTLPLQETLAAAASTVVGLMRYIAVLALVLAGGDYYFQRRNHQQDLRMTKQEVKDERRQNDGSPELRRAIRSKARRMSRMNMMAAVASATAVVTNPTHYAVAIAYDRDNDRAPRVVAKGADFVAFAIRERAKSCGVTVVENPLLARTLYASCEVDDVVPPDLYAAVARLLAFVYTLTSTARAFRDVHTMAN